MPAGRSKGCFYRTAGFTLIELTLVVAIVLVLLGLSAPQFRNTFSGLIVKDTAYTLSKIAGHAQAKAVMERKLCRITFDFDAGRYRLSEADLQTGTDPVYRDLRGRFGKPFLLPRGLFFRESGGGRAGPGSGAYSKSVNFYPDGRCDPFELEIVDRRGKAYRIFSKGLGGYIKTEEAGNA